MEVINSLTNECRVPTLNDKVYKDECTFSFDSPESPDGIFICLKTFFSFGKRYVEAYHQMTKNRVFLQYKMIKRAKKNIKSDECGEQKRTKLGIGVEGGFDLPQDMYTLEEEYTLVVLPDWSTVALPNEALPGPVRASVEGVCAAESAVLAAEKAALTAAWEVEARTVCKHAENLVQLGGGMKVPTSGWKCAECDMKENLWLNLTDGSVMCGRRFWDGSGGNNHAVEHFQKTQYPLAVKLGTITPQGGDVYCYAEDEMMIDPRLADHLAHFGIDSMRMQKTDKTMLELEIDYNERVGEWTAIQESDSQLEALYGPGFTGIRNLGNSCYINSIVQVMFCVPDFIERYSRSAETVIAECMAGKTDPTGDLLVQLCKLGKALMTGEGSHPPAQGDIKDGDVIPPHPGIRPQLLKLLLGRGHPEFSSKRQQDAQELLLHLIDLVSREVHKNGGADPTRALAFEMEQRLQCGQTQQVRYSQRGEYLLSLPIPLDAMTNRAQVEAYEKKRKEEGAQKMDPALHVRPLIPFQACLNAFTAPDLVDDFVSPVTGQRGQAIKTSRLASFPDCLVVHMRKFTLGADWVATKLDVELDLPDEIDISELRARGLQPEEVVMQEPAQPQQQGIVLDEGVVGQLIGMGFPETACRKALYRTGNSGPDAAMNWIFEHMEDRDFADPLPELSAPSVGTSAAPSQEAVDMMAAMGFNRQQALRALKATDNNLERAADWAFNHMDELDAPEETVQPAGGPAPPASQYRDGPGRYKLFAFVSHMGPSAHCGHYVCHIKKGGQWVIFNDEKVARSEHPPRRLAYMYFFRRADLPDWP